MVYSGVGHAPPRNAASLVATGFIVMVEFAHFNRDEEEFPMTEDRLLIEELAAKGGQPDFLRTIAENVLQLIMEADVEGLIGAAATNAAASARPGATATATGRWTRGRAR
jgi:putative transposase